MNSSDQKICKDCKHYRYFQVDIHKCARSREVDLVRGTPPLKCCFSERSRHTKDVCGEEAKFFEPK